MKFKSFIKLPDNKRFNFSPRYYDPIKEDIEMRESLIESDMKLKQSGESVGGRISIAFERKRNQEKKGSVLIRLAIVIMLGLLSYYLFF